MNRTTTKEMYIVIVLLFTACGFILGLAICKSKGEVRYERNDNGKIEEVYEPDPRTPSEDVDIHEEKYERNAPNDPFIEEKDDAYGLGVDMDQYGRPVRERVITNDE